MQAQVESRGINLILGDSLDIEGEIPSSTPAEGLKTKKGQVLKADLVVSIRSIQFNILQSIYHLSLPRYAQPAQNQIPLTSPLRSLPS